jgi:hypothetical protein
MHDPELEYQEATLHAFDRTRGMTDAECRSAETALVLAAVERLEFPRRTELLDELERRPNRAYRYLVLDTFKAVADAHVPRRANSPDAYAQGIEAYLRGDPSRVVPFVTANHVARTWAAPHTNCGGPPRRRADPRPTPPGRSAIAARPDQRERHDATRTAAACHRVAPTQPPREQEEIGRPEERGRQVHRNDGATAASVTTHKMMPTTLATIAEARRPHRPAARARSAPCDAAPR